MAARLQQLLDFFVIQLLDAHPVTPVFVWCGRLTALHCLDQTGSNLPTRGSSCPLRRWWTPMFGRSAELRRCLGNERNRSLCRTLPKRAQARVTTRDRNPRPKKGNNDE